MTRLSIVCVSACSLPQAIALPPERTLEVDVVELIEGREVAGNADFAIEHEGIEYRFASEKTKETFGKDPAKYAVADGGECGRMGPLAGLGDARRRSVHAGRVYFFASDGCRENFLKSPESDIESADEKIFGSHEQVLAGRATLDKVVAWSGGEDRLRELTAYRASAVRKEMQGGKEWSITNETVISFPASYFQKEAWNDSWFSTTCTSDGGAMASTKGEERIATSRAQAFRRTMARWPVVILKAHIDKSPQADCPGLIVIGDGNGKLGDTDVELVKVWLNGAASRWAVDKTTGKLLQVAFRGRDSTMKIGDSVRTFTTFATVDSVTLPTAYTVQFDGKELAQAAVKFDAFEINPKLAHDMFKVPK